MFSTLVTETLSSGVEYEQTTALSTPTVRPEAAQLTNDAGGAPVVEVEVAGPEAANAAVAVVVAGGPIVAGFPRRSQWQ